MAFRNRGLSSSPPYVPPRGKRAAGVQGTVEDQLRTIGRTTDFVPSDGNSLFESVRRQIDSTYVPTVSYLRSLVSHEGETKQDKYLCGDLAQMFSSLSWFTEMQKVRKDMYWNLTLHYMYINLLSGALDRKIVVFRNNFAPYEYGSDGHPINSCTIVIVESGVPNRFHGSRLAEGAMGLRAYELFEPRFQSQVPKKGASLVTRPSTTILEDEFKKMWNRPGRQSQSSPLQPFQACQSNATNPLYGATGRRSPSMTSPRFQADSSPHSSSAGCMPEDNQFVSPTRKIAVAAKATTEELHQLALELQNLSAGEIIQRMKGECSTQRRGRSSSFARIVAVASQATNEELQLMSEELQNLPVDEIRQVLGGYSEDLSEAESDPPTLSKRASSPKHTDNAPSYALKYNAMLQETNQLSKELENLTLAEIRERLLGLNPVPRQRHCSTYGSEQMTRFRTPKSSAKRYSESDAGNYQPPSNAEKIHSSACDQHRLRRQTESDAIARDKYDFTILGRQQKEKRSKTQKVKKLFRLRNRIDEEEDDSRPTYLHNSVEDVDYNIPDVDCICHAKGI